MICDRLTYLINETLSSGVFPKTLKTAKVIPIFKSGKKSNCENYRPISIFSVLSKVFERETVYIHASKQPFLLSSIRIQIKKEYTACTNGPNGTDSEYCPFDVSCELLDLRKDFDTINHEILLFN